MATNPKKKRLFFWAGWVVLTALTSWLTSAGCSGVDEVDGSALCDDAIQAISQRTLACTGDRDAANARYATLKAQATCKAGLTVGPGADDPRFHCTQAIQLVPCSEVATRADNLRAWLTDATCSQIFDFSPVDGGVGDASDGGSP